MAKLYYGGGDCNIEGNVSSLTINYRGAIMIISKLPDSYAINLESGKLIIEALSNPQHLNELFIYLGYFKIISVTAYNLEGDKEPTTIQRVMDYTELLTGDTETMTINTEDLKVGYIQGRTFKKTRVLPRNINTKHSNTSRAVY